MRDSRINHQYQAWINTLLVGTTVGGLVFAACAVASGKNFADRGGLLAGVCFGIGVGSTCLAKLIVHDEQNYREGYEDALTAVRSGKVSINLDIPVQQISETLEPSSSAGSDSAAVWAVPPLNNLSSPNAIGPNSTNDASFLDAAM